MKATQLTMTSQAPVVELQALHFESEFQQIPQPIQLKVSTQIYIKVTMRAKILNRSRKEEWFKRTFSAGGASPMECLIEARKTFDEMLRHNHQGTWVPEPELTRVTADNECPGLIIFHIPGGK